MNSFNFEVVAVMPPEELVELVRQTPLLGQPETRPYADAEISIERFRLSQLYSTTRYILTDLLHVQENLRSNLLPQGYDQLDLRAGRLVLQDGTRIVRIMPPVVERYEPHSMMNYILDGGHRAQFVRQLAAQEDVADPQLTVVYVRDGISYPPYAFTNHWEEVKVVSERPADKSSWKNYRDFPNRYKLYRDYSHIIDSEPRGLDEQTN